MVQKTYMPPQVRNTQTRTPIVQRWIETADERCPLAGMWTVLTADQVESATEDDLPRRILRVLLRGCATSLPCIA